MTTKDEFVENPANKMKQARFIIDHCTRVMEEMLKAITSGVVPDEFDGHEFRVWCSEKFKEAAHPTYLRLHPHSARNKVYKNWKATTPGV